MPQMNHLEIYRLLQKSNCRKCELPTCLAFAAAVMRGEKRLEVCPYVDRAIVERLEAEAGPRVSVDAERQRVLGELRAQVAAVNLAEVAERLGASHSGDALTVRCLSKDFHVDSQGQIHSDCHATP